MVAHPPHDLQVCECTVDWDIFVVKIFCRWPTTTKIRHTKNFQCRSDEVGIALLGYMKPVCGLPDRRRLFFFSHMSNSIKVCSAYRYL